MSMENVISGASHARSFTPPDARIAKSPALCKTYQIPNDVLPRIRRCRVCDVHGTQFVRHAVTHSSALEVDIHAPQPFSLRMAVGAGPPESSCSASFVPGQSLGELVCWCTSCMFSDLQIETCPGLWRNRIVDAEQSADMEPSTCWN